MKELTLAGVVDLVGLQLGVHAAGPDDRLRDDLGAESADLVNLLAALEDRFGVAIDETELNSLHTPRDLFERAKRS